MTTKITHVQLSFSVPQPMKRGKFKRQVVKRAVLAAAEKLDIANPFDLLYTVTGPCTQDITTDGADIRGELKVTFTINESDIVISDLPHNKPPHKIKLGDEITFVTFSFTNTAGGTGLSNWNHNEKIIGTFKARVTKKWHDYETGWHYWGQPLDEKLKAYLKANAHHDHQEEVYISQWELK